jgi:hypothetical protein
MGNTLAVFRRKRVSNWPDSDEVPLTALPKPYLDERVSLISLRCLVHVNQYSYNFRQSSK